MFSWFREWNKFENRSIFDEIKAHKKPYKTKGVSFLEHPVVILFTVNSTRKKALWYRLMLMSHMHGMPQPIKIQITINSYYTLTGSMQIPLEKKKHHSVNSSSDSVNGNIAIQWEWSNFDPSQNSNPLTDYDKSLHNWLRTRDEHVTQNLCQSTLRERLRKYVKYKSLSIFYSDLFFSRTRLLKWSMHGFSRTVSEITRNHARKCLFGVCTITENM